MDAESAGGVKLRWYNMERVPITIYKYKTADGVLFENSGDARKHEKSIPVDKYYQKLSNTLEFNVTEKHINLIKRINIKWGFNKDEYNFGALYQDNYRPYGNSDWIGDIAEIIGIKKQDEEFADEFTDEQIDELALLNMDMRICIPILFNNLYIQVGVYKRTSQYADNWKLIESEK